MGVALMLGDLRAMSEPWFLHRLQTLSKFCWDGWGEGLKGVSGSPLHPEVLADALMPWTALCRL